MIHLSREDTKLMVAVHGWSGILLGLLLYAVVVTGMVAVFAEEIGIWSAGHVETRSAFARPFDATVRELAARTPARDHEGVDMFEIGDRRLGIFFHHHELSPRGEPVSRGVYYQLGADGSVANTVRGIGEEVFGPRNDDALSSFLVDTHVRLHVPDPWGLLLTGILGLAMLVAAISGLLIHRHLFKDIFTLRRRANPVLVDRDRHSVAGTWSLPFAFLLAFTGSFFSFFGTVGVPIVAMAAFGGDQQALSDAVFGNPGKEDKSLRPIGDLDRMAADATRRAGGAPIFVSIEHYGRADAKITTFHDPAPGGLEPLTLLYGGPTAAFERTKPSIGTVPSTGGTLAAIMAPIHFGHFAGLLSKAIWFGLGFAMCYVTFTGLRLWLVRRREGARSLGWLERAVTVVGLGLPFALVASAVGFLFTMPLGTAVYWTPAAFLIASAVAILGGLFARSNDLLDRGLHLATGLLLVALPLLRLIAGGPGWAGAMAVGQPIIIALDCAMMLGGGWMLWRRFGGSIPRFGRRPRLQAAE
ncbi:PepSY-associated TM helix domain-containing protein [Rhizorhabdus dicambivorans]|uniref:PepSY domain-containing protein n=1 Tax=Rhizorhabdus dicambivorans TaxID=1850238 RepID=A0A2A4G1E4_9SPHN|nr:PepSY-associated TM helix domain-containing protein [Rhizorhabdus dicambivorans]ATE66691.1 PepSY domain-containing protein [Rhizorhabdus dicambivorans]PCE43823.1 PepSY domain-containing protein [Rhizorhabdus dicambivorans]